MPDLSGFPYAEAQFDRDGNLSPSRQKAAVFRAVGAAQPTDLVVIAHGWNNDTADARNLYAEIFAHVRTVLPQAQLSGDRRLAVLGLLWPSKKFTDRELIPGGGAASVGRARDVSKASLKRQIDLLGEVAAPGAPDLDEAKGLLDKLETHPAARARFLQLGRDSLDPPDAAPPGGAAPEASRSALDHDPEEIFNDLKARVRDEPRESGLGGAASTGGAAGIGAPFESFRAGAERLLNFATYYQMKERAGRVGRSGAASLLGELRGKFPELRIHLVGHSFGARLVTAAADACGTEVRLASMLLLQAAFSHNSFSPSFKFGQRTFSGLFRSVVQAGKVTGPIVITHTANDRAVGLAYALASRIARQTASGLGDANDVYGGLGRNGAVRTPEAEHGGPPLELLPAGGRYGFAAGKLFNLNADGFILDHSGIRNAAVAYAMLRTLA